MHWTYAGRETSRLGSRALGPWFITDCVDGKLFALAVEEEQWQRLVALMGNPEWAGEEIFADRLVRGQNLDALKLFMDDWLGAWKVDDLYREAQANRIPFAPVNSMMLASQNRESAGSIVSSTANALASRIALPLRYSASTFSSK